MKLVPSTSIISDFNEVFGNPLVVGGLLLARVATALVRSWKAATFSNETAATGSGRIERHGFRKSLETVLPSPATGRLEHARTACVSSTSPAVATEHTSYAGATRVRRSAARKAYLS